MKQLTESVIFWFIEIKFTNSNTIKDCEYHLDLKGLMENW